MNEPLLLGVGGNLVPPIAWPAHMSCQLARRPITYAISTHFSNLLTTKPRLMLQYISHDSKHSVNILSPTHKHDKVGESCVVWYSWVLTEISRILCNDDWIIHGQYNNSYYSFPFYFLKYNIAHFMRETLYSLTLLAPG